MKKEKQPKTKTPRPAKAPNLRKLQRREKYRNKQSATSIYFLLWAIFATLSLAVVVFSGVMQKYVLVKTYKEEALHEVTEKGRVLEEEILDLPQWAGDNYNGYLRTLSSEYGVRLYILDVNGNVVFPQEPNFDATAPEVQNRLDFSKEMPRLLEELADAQHVVYEGNGEYVYAARVTMFQNRDTYLYVGRSLEFIETVTSSMNLRMVLISTFVFILSFTVMSAVAGILTNPLAEMTAKARRLAQGDFDVDFNGYNYGKEMVELAEALNYARDELSKTDRMQKDLIANVSHDFKTPLTMIKGYASMIIEISGDVPEKRNKHAQIIVDEADRLASLVNDVLDLSKMSSGIEVLKQNVFDMSAYLQEVLDRFAYLKETQGYVFELDIEEDLYTRGDEMKLGQVLYNLIGNAVNYTGEDKTVRVVLKKEGENAFRFSVTDTGKGIKPEEIPEIWNRYYRSAEMHKRPVKGTGLGLSIVKTVLERHDFVYGVDSEVGKGSTFYVLFPFVAETTEEKQ